MAELPHEITVDIKLKHVKILRLKENDALIIKSKTILSQKQIETFEINIRKMINIPETVKILILSPGIDISILSNKK
jgi:hypothetical protein